MSYLSLARSVYDRDGKSPSPEELIADLNDDVLAFSSSQQPSANLLTRIGSGIIYLSEMFKSRTPQSGSKVTTDAFELAQWYNRTSSQFPVAHSTSQHEGLDHRVAIHFFALGATEFLRYFATGEEVMCEYVQQI